jgi:hypothetical protein
VRAALYQVVVLPLQYHSNLNTVYRELIKALWLTLRSKYVIEFYGLITHSVFPKLLNDMGLRLTM